MTPFSATLRSEWTKLASLRSTAVVTCVAIAGSVLLTVLLSVVIGETWRDWGPEEQREFEPIGWSLIGGIWSGILFTVLGITVATSEYGSGMIRQTLTATPRRGRVLAAKAAVVALFTLAAGLVSTVGMFLVAEPLLASYGLPSASLGDADARRTVLLSSALFPLLPVIAIALGLALRSAVWAVVAVLVLVFAPVFLGGLLPAWFSDDVLVWGPIAASDAVSIGHLPGAEDGLSPAVAILAVAAWAALFLGGAWALLERRDA
jgi:ABC-2 type transport system permease protein